MMPPKSALFLTYDGLTDPLGQSQILPYIIGIGKSGYNFTIVSFEKKEKANLVPEILNICTSHNIRWIRCSFTRTPRYIAKFYDLIRFYKVVKKTLRQGDFQVVHCRSYQSAYLAQKLKHRFKFTSIFDMRGFWIDERVEGGIWNTKNPLFFLLFKTLKSMEKNLILDADHVISLTNTAAATINEKIIPQQKREINVIPCCADLQLFDLARISKLKVVDRRAQLTIEPEQFVLGYLGAIGSWYLLPRMVSFFSKILQERPDAVFLFITQESQEIVHEEFEKQGLSLEQLRIVKAARRDVPIYLAILDWLVFFTAPSFSHLARSPVKQGEAMSMGKPVICNKGIGDSEELINKYNSGMVLDNLEDSTLSSAANSIVRRKINRDAIVLGAREYFDLENGIQKYVEIYDRIVDRADDTTIVEK